MCCHVIHGLIPYFVHVLLLCIWLVTPCSLYLSQDFTDSAFLLPIILLVWISCSVFPAQLKDSRLFINQWEQYILTVYRDCSTAEGFILAHSSRDNWSWWDRQGSRSVRSHHTHSQEAESDWCWDHLALPFAFCLGPMHGLRLFTVRGWGLSTSVNPI